jgi:hypothetical protein
VFTLKLFGKVCSYSDGYSLEDKTSQVFEELALTGDLLSRVTKLSRMTRNTTLGRLETDIELTVRTLEQEEEEE